MVLPRLCPYWIFTRFYCSASPNGPSFELVGRSPVYLPARPSAIAYRPSHPRQLTSSPYGGFNFDSSTTSPTHPSLMSPTLDGRRNSSKYRVPFQHVGYGTYAYELPRHDTSIVSPNSISTSPAHCGFAPKLEHIKEKKLYRVGTLVMMLTSHSSVETENACTAWRFAYLTMTVQACHALTSRM